MKRKFLQLAVVALFLQLVCVAFHSLCIHAAQSENGELEKWNEAILRNPNDADAFAKRAAIRAQQGDHKGAIEDYSAAIRLNPGSAKLYAARGRERKVTGDKDGADDDSFIAEDIEIQPRGSNDWWNRSLANRRAMRYREAVNDICEYIKLKPNDPEGYYYRALARSGFGDRKGAIDDYSHAVRLKPNYANAYFNRAWEESLLGDNQSALEDYTQSIRLNPRDVNGYINRGLVKRTLKDAKGAIADFTEALRVEPRNAGTFHNRALAKCDAQDWKGCLDDCNQSIQLQPMNAFPYDCRAAAKFNLGDKQGALQDYSNALRLQENAKFYYSRGWLKSEMKDIKGAIEDLKQAIRMQPDHQHAAAILEKLQSSTASNVPIVNRDPTVVGAPTASSTAAASSTANQGKNCAILIATNQYQDPHYSRLANPIADAHEIGNILRKYYGWNTIVLENPRRKQILKTLIEHLNEPHSPQDQLFIYFAGHGLFDQKLHDGVVVTTDSQSADELRDSFISYSMLKTLLDRSRVNKVLLTMDICFGGAFLEQVARNTRSSGEDIYSGSSLDKIIAETRDRRARKLLAPGGKEPVFDGTPGRHSPLAFHLLTALRAKGERKGFLRFSDIQKVAEETKPRGIATFFSDDDPLGDFLFIPVKK